MKYVKTIFALAILALSGCWTRPGSIKTPNGSVMGVKDAGKPATLDSGVKVESLPIPEGTTLVGTKTAEVPATANSPYLPAVEKFEFKFDKPTQWTRTENTTKASTGTVDTSIAAKRIDVEESRPFLYAAIASMIGVGVFMWLKYPTPAYICGGSAVIFFMAWKLSDLPSWFWAIGLVGAAAAIFIWLGHERGEEHAANTQPK